MTLHYLTPEGKKVATADIAFDNSAGAEAADIAVTATFTELENVIEVLAVTVWGGGTLKGWTKNDPTANSVTVTVNVPAGTVAYARVLVVGY